MKKNIVAYLTALLLFLNILSVSATPKIYLDSNTGYYFNILSKLGLLTIYQDDEVMFEDAKAVTRAEAAMVLANFFALSTYSGRGTIDDIFIDVPSYDEAADSIEAVVNMGIMTGFGNSVFGTEDGIRTTHFIKSMIIALGYQWSAEAKGGYPSGYIAKAGELGLLTDVKMEAESILTRGDMLKILYNSLKSPICEPKKIVTDYITFEINKDVTLLTKYHKIYQDTDIVYSNDMLSLKKSFTANTKTILIGNETIEVGGAQEVWSHIGQNIRYYYAYSQKDDVKKLLYFEPEKNEIYTLKDSEIVAYQNQRLSYIKQDANKIYKLNISISADILYNGGTETVNLDQKLNTLSGVAMFIDNNSDGFVDVVVIKDYQYDMIDGVDKAEEIIYGAEQAIRFADVKRGKITNALGEEISVADLKIGDVLSIEKNQTDSILSITVINNKTVGTVKEIQTGTQPSILIQDKLYPVAKNCSQIGLNKVKIGAELTFFINEYGEIAYISDKGQQSNLQLGYLIKGQEEYNALQYSLLLKMVLSAGEVKVLSVRETLKLNGETIKAKELLQKLKILKQALKIVSDGVVAQVVRYKLNGSNEISEIYTANSENNDDLTLKFNSMGAEIWFRNHGYGTGAFDLKWLIGKNTVAFQVPQMGQDGLDDDYFTTVRYEEAFEDGKSYNVETYTTRNEFYPITAVLYKTSADTATVRNTATLFVVDNIKTVLDEKGEVYKQLCGQQDGVDKTYQVLEEADLSGVDSGDVVVFETNLLGQIKLLERVFDYRTQTVSNQYYGDNMKSIRSIRLFHVYHVSGDNLEAAYSDFTDLDIANENMYVFHLSRIPKISLYDPSKSKNKLTTVDKSAIIDYLHDPTGYTKMIARHSQGYLEDIILYK